MWFSLNVTNINSGILGAILLTLTYNLASLKTTNIFLLLWNGWAYKNKWVVAIYDCHLGSNKPFTVLNDYKSQIARIFVTFSPFHLSLIFIGKVRANIILRWNWVAVANPLVYCSMATIMGAKRFIVQAPAACTINVLQ